ncbi:hypothetical protein [Fowlpox virus]|nr:hypothetical protein [Fowlpox virus]AXY04695.1 hypothetical protein [Fowlpox virus]AXY04710.1 hypothetical protein [Fowlpox virus]AXY04958.1 hypothetical protein [Fowlpox virus]AXY04969.1 hypothetical protein [Fowlpox virus]
MLYSVFTRIYKIRKNNKTEMILAIYDRNAYIVKKTGIGSILLRDNGTRNTMLNIIYDTNSRNMQMVLRVSVL